MGYSHYWIIADPIEGEAWEKFRVGANAIIDIAQEGGIPLEVTLDPKVVSFNGIGATAHETFSILLGDAEFDFCKTAGKGYDPVVCAVLIHLKAVLGDGVLIKSDGKWDTDWESGRLLYETVFDIQPESILNGTT